MSTAKRPRRSLAVALALLSVLALGASAARAVIEQQGNLRVHVQGNISPRALPREEAAPIAVSVAGEVSTTDGTLPPQLRQMRIEINRNGRLEYRGLPVCQYHRIQPANNERALAACRPSLVGEGTFSGYILLKGQEPFPTQGRLLVFYGQRRGKPVLLGHIYLAQPFASSFVITFAIESRRHGAYGTVLTADLAKVLGTRRYLTGIELNLSRRYRYGGTRHSFFSAACPAPKGFRTALFPMVRTSFAFADDRSFALTVSGECKVR